MAAVDTVKLRGNTELDKTSFPPGAYVRMKKTDNKQDKNTVCCVLIRVLERGRLGGAGWEEFVLMGRQQSLPAEAASL